MKYLQKTLTSQRMRHSWLMKIFNEAGHTSWPQHRVLTTLAQTIDLGPEQIKWTVLVISSEDWWGTVSEQSNIIWTRWFIVTTETVSHWSNITFVSWWWQERSWPCLQICLIMVVTEQLQMFIETSENDPNQAVIIIESWEFTWSEYFTFINSADCGWFVSELGKDAFLRTEIDSETGEILAWEALYCVY